MRYKYFNVVSNLSNIVYFKKLHISKNTSKLDFVKLNFKYTISIA